MGKSRGMLSLAAAPLVLVIAMLLYVGIAAEEEARACAPGGTSDVVATAVNLSTVAEGPVAGYRREQLINAAHILNAAAELHLTRRDQQIGVMTAMGESGLRVLDHGDAAGPDSRGLFQQRSGGAWGSLADRMDPHISATNFFNALAGIAGRDALEPTLVANRVQRNADPYHYRAYWGSAGDVVDALAPASAAVVNVTDPTTPTAQGEDPTGYNLGPVQPQLAQLVAALGPMFDITSVGGYRPSATDPNGHPAGLAADFMVPLDAAGRAQGNALAAYAMTNATALKVDYILWQQRIWSAARASEGWRPMADRGSATENHLDHVHINVLPDGAATPTTSTVSTTTEFPYCLTSATSSDWVTPLEDAPVSSPFGVRVHPVTGQPSFHDGVDYAASCGTSVAAASSGTVIKAGPDPIYGHQIVIDHGRVAEGQLRIGTLNWRGASHFTKNPYPGERHYSVRVPNMINELNEAGTSIVGFQEFEQPQADAFLAGTRGTWEIVPGRRRGTTNTADAIAYQPALWSVDEIRYVTIRYGGPLIQLPMVRFTSTGDAGSVWVLNAHNPANSIGGTDAMRDAAVRAEAEALRQAQQGEPDTPVFLVGDMNDRERFRQVFLAQAGTGWSSANPSDEQVDWVMGGPGVTFSDAVVDRTTNDRAHSYTDHPFVHASAALPGDTTTASAIQTKYGHMEASGVLVRVGDQVATGQVIAEVGSAGLSTGCHLHFTVEVDGEPTDPVTFLADRIPETTARRVRAGAAAPHEAA